MRPKNLYASVAVPPASVRIPSQRPLAPRVASVTLVANDKGDNEMIRGTVRPVIASNGVPFLQVRSVGSHRTPGREKEGMS